MDKLPILAGITHISHEQQRVVEHLWRMTGQCSGCKTILTERSPKSCFGTVNSSYCMIPSVRNTIGMSLFCGSCTEKMSALIRQMRVPEPSGLIPNRGNNSDAISERA